MTALRSCALCSASGSAPIVVAIAMLASLPVSSLSRSGLLVARSPSTTIRQAAADGYRSKVARRAPRGTRPIWRFLQCGNRNFWRGLLARLVRRHHGDRRVAILIGKQPLQIADFRLVVDDDVRVGRVQYQKVLVIVLGRIKTLEGFELGHDRRFEDVGLIELGDITFGNPLLLVIGIEDRRAIGRAGIGAL